MKLVNELLIYAIMSDSLRVVYKQFVTMLIELKKLLCQVLKNLFVHRNYHNPTGMNHTTTMDVSLLYFYCIRNKYVVQKCVNYV